MVVEIFKFIVHKVLVNLPVKTDKLTVQWLEACIEYFYSFYKNPLVKHNTTELSNKLKIIRNVVSL